ncbi:cilia- and flagella-associated protein 57-like isoform X2 [Antedon mediterranea]|uniref:cilia- and flagella-associated protein 57-like isoform X2 n=1 Tax=Antedon mediterranea TaxID=105859 RepID=UPI003AF46AD3
MSIATAQPRHVFGLKGKVNNNICYVDEQTIVYPSGANTVLYNIDQKSQKFIAGSEKSLGTTAMCVSPNRRYIAIAEKGSEKATITIYDLHSLRKRKVLSSPDIQSVEFVSLAFSPDSKYLIAQAGRPDWILLYWTWEKSKVMASTKTSNPANNDIYQVSFNPQDNTQICVVGNGIFKLFRYSEGNLRQFAFQKLEPQNYLSQAWVSDERVIVGTDNGKLFLFESGELRNEFSIVTKEKEMERVGSIAEGDLVPSGPPPVTAIVAYSKGFACSGGIGTVHLFEKTEDKDNYKKGREIKIPQDAIGADPTRQENHTIKTVTVSPSEETLVCSTITNQLYCMTLSSADLGKHGDQATFELLSQPFHFGTISGSDVCIRKPLIATCSVDRSVRIWNYETNSIELHKEFQEEAYSIALHPSGLFILVGFSDKLRLMNLLIDDIRTFKEFTVRGCRECSFSNGGHMFAAVHGNVIQVYSTSTFEIINNLKEITDSQILRDVEATDVTLTQVAMSHNGRMLFAGTSAGTLRSMKYPLTSPGEWTESMAHGTAITKMRISYDDQYLITVSEDSVLMIWKITDKEGRGLKRDKEIGYAEEILITKSDLEEKNSVMAELKTRVEELKMENEYQLRLKDMNYNEKIKELTEKFIQEMESLKTKNQVLKTDKDKEEARHEEELAEIMEKNSKENQDLELANNQKLMIEYEKYQELQSKSQKMQEDYERQLQEMEESKEQALEELTEYYQTKLQEKTIQLDQANDEARHQQREYEETKKQIEEDADREILDIKNKYERRLRDEKEANMRLKGETGIMRKKFTSLQKEIEDHKDEIKKLQNEQSKLQSVIKSLEKDIFGLKKEIQERDETIQDKEKRIYDLKKKNQELEKFKFVLDYKIKELKKQIEPRENDIKAMKDQIQEMESELERFHKQNTQLELNITELRQKLKATEKEMYMERQRVRDSEAVMKRFKTDLHNCVAFIQEPKKLKESIKQLYAKHVQDDTPESASVDGDIQREYSRQRKHLEQSVASLRKKLTKDTEIHRADNVRIMQENVSLIKEINDLRRELKIARTQVHDLEAALGINRKNKTQQDSHENVDNIQHASTTLSSGEGRTEENIRIIEMQRSEIKKLRIQLHDIETVSRPPSGGKLPPVLAQ